MGIVADGSGVTANELRSAMEAQMLLRRLPTLAEVASVTTFIAFDRTSATTGTVGNVSTRSIVD